MAEIERKYRKVEILLEDFLKRSDKLLRMDGVRSHIAKSIGKDFEILSGRGFERTIKNRDLAIFLRKYF